MCIIGDGGGGGFNRRGQRGQRKPIPSESNPAEPIPADVQSIHAGTTDKDAVEYTVALLGDGEELKAQFTLLKLRKISAKWIHGGLCVKSTEDFKTAIRMFWENKIPGWKNYKDQLIEHEICSQAQFASAEQFEDRMQQ